MTRGALALIGMLALGVEPLIDRVAAHKPITTSVSWTREISSMFARHCVSCHRPNGFGGFALTTFDETRPWAVAIKEEVLAGTMPPWSAAAGVGHFANDRRLTRHELELVAAWVDGGAPYAPAARTPAFAPAAQAPVSAAAAGDPYGGSVAVPLAPATISEPAERTASVTLQLPDGMTLTAWTFEPGLQASVERVDLELASRWLGTWVPGERRIEFPPDAGAPLTSSALFAARISYRAPAAETIDRSRLRLWMTKDVRPKSIREVAVVRSWRAAADAELVAIRPARDRDALQVAVRYAGGRIEPLGAFTEPPGLPHPTYRFARPVNIPAGARVETTAPVRLLYSGGATRMVKPNVRRRPRR